MRKNDIQRKGKDNMPKVKDFGGIVLRAGSKNMSKEIEVEKEEGSISSNLKRTISNLESIYTSIKELKGRLFDEKDSDEKGETESLTSVELGTRIIANFSQKLAEKLHDILNRI